MRRAAAAGLGAIGWLMVLAPGCGGGGGNGDVPFNRLAAGYATVLCHKQIVCCDVSELGVAVDPSDLPAIEATCRANLADAWAVDLAPYVPLISAGRIIYHGDRARLCLDEIAAQPCADWGASAYLNQYPDCLRIYEGTISLGGACTLSEECADSVCSSAIGPGVCTARLPYARIGESCSPSSCEPGLTCVRDASGASTVCATPLANGTTCYHDSNCASTFCEANVCGPPTMCNGI
jgi:hypothetical protein